MGVMGNYILLDTIPKKNQQHEFIIKKLSSMHLKNNDTHWKEFNIQS
jgi:hypothetical protein